jgi:hypothetical protein
MEPYAARAIRSRGLRRPSGWQLKLYTVSHAATAVDLHDFEPGMQLAEQVLPSPAVATGRPGVGFLIAHQGRTGDYVVVGWWANENELPIRVFVRRQRGEPWRAARGDESVCVWDLEILWAEREAYVRTMLAPSGSDVAAYLKSSFSVG